MTTIRTGKFQQTQYNGYYEEIDEGYIHKQSNYDILEDYH